MTRGVPGSTAPHGTHARYVAGCRCDDCRAARAAYQKRTHYARLVGCPGLIPSIGTTRRMQALARLGWAPRDLGARLHLSERHVQNLRRTHAPRVERATAERVRALYDELAMTPGKSNRTRRYAERSGWVPPLAWDDDTIDDPKATPYREDRDRTEYRTVDEVAVERVLAGEVLELTVAEREVVVRRLAREGLSDHQIADRIGVWPETVLRTRRRLGIESRWVAA